MLSFLYILRKWKPKRKGRRRKYTLRSNDNFNARAFYFRWKCLKNLMSVSSDDNTSCSVLALLKNRFMWSGRAFCLNFALFKSRFLQFIFTLSRRRLTDMIQCDLNWYTKYITTRHLKNSEDFYISWLF